MGIIDFLNNNGSEIALIGALISLFVSVLSLINSNRIKSYEFMIRHRMDTYDQIKKSLLHLKKITKTDSVKDCLENGCGNQVLQQFDEEMDRLDILLTRTEPQEYALLAEFDTLRDSLSVCLKPDLTPKWKELKDQADICFIFADIYTWALWQYLQRLYKNFLFHLPKLFQRRMKKAYKNAKKLFSKEHPFFKKYDSVKKLKTRNRPKS